MTTALYRRYRPETFGELVGQSHVTEPLMTALRADRVNHAYLFSGPRGCGKTTSARILARCLNCAKGPTDTPCGECDSCRELGRDGQGSIDVIEIDAASHGGVDDARDLRERATLAPGRDRYKIYIIDEAHMVSKDGFNALLKIVEEPPEHVKFIFATTEPDKVIGTIRSRTHHYPFRLIPPATLLDYITQVVEHEGVQVEAGVLPLVVRAGGGSARDTLSLLDQLIAGSEGSVTYERAASLLGFTPAELLDDVTATLAAGDAQGAFQAVETVLSTGQDPRRFVEDLLEHLRNLMIAVVAPDAEGLFQGMQPEELERMRDRAHDFGPVRLSRVADVTAESLNAMSGATSPKLQLELLIARLLVAVDALGGDAPARPAPTRAQQPRPAASSEPSAPPATVSGPAPEPQAAPTQPDVPVVAEPAVDAAPAAEPQSEPETASLDAAASAPESSEAAGPLTFNRLEDSWPEVLQALGASDRSAWMLAESMRPVALQGTQVIVQFRTMGDLHQFRQGKDASGGMLWHRIRDALTERFGSEFSFRPTDEQLAEMQREQRQTEPAPEPVEPAQPAPAPEPQPAPAPQPPAGGGWAVAKIPESGPDDFDPWADSAPADVAAPGEPQAPLPQPRHANPAAAAPVPAPPPEPAEAPPSLEDSRYGEAVVREELGAVFLEEITEE